MDHENILGDHRDWLGSYCRNSPYVRLGRDRFIESCRMGNHGYYERTQSRSRCSYRSNRASQLADREREQGDAR